MYGKITTDLMGKIKDSETKWGKVRVGPHGNKTKGPPD